MCKYSSKFKRGPMHNIMLLFRYAEGKEATVMVSALLPSTYSRDIDFYINLAIPGFNACTARFTAIERTKRLQYDINMQGTWFTGHSITIYGTYDDKSTTKESRYQLKLVLKSPHFNETAILARYLRNDTALTIETNIDYGENPYAIVISHNHIEFYEQSVYAEIKILDKSYWISARTSDENFRKLSVDLHIDRVREIRLVIGGQSDPVKKEIEVKISWDSNRDPTQELYFNAEFNTPKYRTYDGGFTVSYPARTFSGSFDLAIPGPTYCGNLSVGWRANESIHLSFDSGTYYEPNKHLYMDLRLETPFKGWNNNMLQGHLYHAKNLLSSNATILWADINKLVLGLHTDFEFNDPNIRCEAKVLVNSTVVQVPSLDASFKHNQDKKQYVTLISIYHAPFNQTPNLYSLDSNWQLHSNEIYSNISGSVEMQTPLKGYTKGSLATKFSLTSSKTLRGAADFEVEQKRFTLAVDGTVKKLTNCMLLVNITTPIEKYRTIDSRFGLITKKRLCVAEIRAPGGALGAEVKFAVESLANFDVILNLESPIEEFKKMMLIAKLDKDMVDFRGGLNKFVLGYIGVSRKASIDDFEYSWRVYTPLDHFEESSLVVKFIRKEIFDMEVMLKFAQKKLGIVVNGKPKQKIIGLPRVKHFATFKSKLSNDFDKFDRYFIPKVDSSEESEEEEEEEENIDGEWSLTGEMELNTIIWPTISGYLDIEDIEEEDYIIRANLKLPAGNIELHDQFYYPDYLNIRNTLQVITPFQTVSDIEILYFHSADIGKHYVLGLESFHKNDKTWNELGFNLNYTKVLDVDQKTHDVELNLYLPFETLPRVTLGGNVEISETIHKANVSGRSINSFMSLAATLESDTNFIDLTAGLALATLTLPHYELKMNFKQDLSISENVLVFGFVEDYNGQSFFRMESTWHNAESNYFKLNSKAVTNLFPITMVESAIVLNRSSNFVGLFDLNMNTLSRDGIAFHLSGKKRGDRINVELSTPLASLANVSMAAILKRLTEPDFYSVSGRLTRNHDIYSVNGTLGFYEHVPVHANLILQPVSRQTPCMVTYTVSPNGNGKSIYLRISEDKAFFETNSVVAANSKFDWFVDTSIDASPGLLSKKLNNNHCTFKVSVKPDKDGRISSDLKLITPWRQYGIDAFSVNAKANIVPPAGDVQLFYDFSLSHGHIISSWTFVLLENMQGLFDFRAESEMGVRTLKFGLRYGNPGKTNQRLTFGGQVDVDSKLNLESNLSAVVITKNDVSGTFAIRLPAPIDDVHKFSAKYRGDIMANPLKDVIIETRYESEKERRRFVSRGQYRNVTDLQALLHAQWGTDTINKTFETNMQMLRKGERRELSAVVKTPLYVEETVQASGYYDKNSIYHILNANVHYPASREIASTHVEFSSVSNVNGFINCTTPFPNVTWLRADLNYSSAGISSSKRASRRFIKTTWPKDFAVFDMTSEFDSHNTDRSHYGQIKMEVPLTSRHTANIEYDLHEHHTLTTGKCSVIYNNNKVLDGKYKCNTESKGGYENDVTEILLNNSYHPVGIVYVHKIEFSDRANPFFDMKRAELYELKDSNRYNITGELHVRTTETGQNYKIVAIHPNRTVVVTSDYDYHDTTVNQKLKLLLSSDMWIAYDFKITYLTTATNDSQVFSVDLQYPKRNLSTSGWYSITDDVFQSDLAFKWTAAKKKEDENPYDYYDNGYDEEEQSENEKQEKKMVKASFIWRNEPLEKNDRFNQSVLLILQHPSFQKDVTFAANYYRNNIDILHGKASIDYHDDPDHLLTLEGGIVDSTALLNHRNYSIHVLGTHEVSSFILKALGSVAARPGIYETKNFGKYKRGYLPLAEGILDGVNLNENDIHYYKVSSHKSFHAWARANGLYPIYTINGTYEDSPDINTSGAFYLNIDDRYVKLDANFTPDASQNLRMLGIIPDARSASFDLWRDYEDIRIVDIAYYLRMNHSRLITSRMVWRPKLKEELKDGFKKLTTQMYDSFSENVDFWVKTSYSEAIEAVAEVWDNAKPHANDFIEDIGGLSVLSEDLEDFRQLMNQSYEANHFYIKTVVNFTLTVLDELAIRDHIGSVPIILKEVWQVLGESGSALRKSIIFVIEQIKEAYKNTIDALNRIFHGEAMSYVSSFVEKAIYKYDRFIKDIHLSFIKYVQNIWNSFSQIVMDYWRSLLEKIQPMVIRLIHYAESLLWNISQEIFEFLHKHTNDLSKSPYFDTVTEFMRDLDTVYRNIQNNDLLINIKKYSKLTWAFLQEKYFKVVPFGKELQNLINELVDEIKKLQKQELVQFMISRIDEWSQKLEWLAEEFQLEKRIHQLWQIVLNKITTYDQTALQMDDKYREAKTKFVFDPNVGVIQLEQKLPMSWHAFNETPLFDEIAELQMISRVFRIFNGVNISVVQFDVLQYYTNPYLWLPPFKARSLLVGSRHHITFDKRFVTLNHRYGFISNEQKPDQCTYLLANDFVDSNFTLTQEPSIAVYNDSLVSTRQLAIVTDGNIINVDLTGAAIRINRNFTTTLPIQIGDTSIYRNLDILVIQSKYGFELNCNLQFDFCWFEVSGWYFGKTAGIMGTMNNEIYDDFLMSNHLVTKDENTFKESWALNNCKHEVVERTPPQVTNEVLNLCDTYFKSKVSPFANCFATVDAAPFYDMCLDMGLNSITNFTHIDHPAQKGVCSVALAYMETCAAESIPLRVPHVCVHCNLVNGSYVVEGTIFELAGEDVPRTTDVVFIVEAKSCNENLMTNKNMGHVISALEKSFTDVDLHNVRYAVVAFGGDAPFDQARSIVYNNDIFTDSHHIKYHFEHIKTSENSSSDISRAIKVASELVFRPGASKTFILMPCSNCNVTDMHFDYSSVLQFLLEHNINLHIFMNGDFETKKPRNERKIFGFDNGYAYTNSYYKETNGDREMRNEIILPKNNLGFCIVWAMETNGTIFTANKLRPNYSRTPIKKFTSVFAKRVARSAIPSTCQSCECTGEDNGVAYVICTRCDFTNAFEEEDINSQFDDKDYMEEDLSSME